MKKKLVTLLFVASLALNVGFLTGCKMLHDTVFGDPCKFASPKQQATQDGKAELVRIAGLLDIKTSGKTASDLSSVIRYKLDRSTEVPLVFDTAAFEKMLKDLNSDEALAMRKYHQFISELQGKRVIVIEPEN